MFGGVCSLGASGQGTCISLVFGSEEFRIMTSNRSLRFRTTGLCAPPVDMTCRQSGR